MTDSDEIKKEFEQTFYWLTHESEGPGYALLGWKPLLEKLPFEQHLKVCQLLMRFDVPYNFHGLKNALNSIELIFRDLIKATEYKFDIATWLELIEAIRDGFELLDNKHYQLYSKTDIHGIATKNPLYVVLLRLNGDQTDFSRFVALPLAVLLLNQVDFSKEQSRLYAIAVQIRKLIEARTVSVRGIDELSSASVTVGIFNVILSGHTPNAVSEASSKSRKFEYVDMLIRLNLLLAVKLIRQTKIYSGERKGGGGKQKGSGIIGRNNQVSILRNTNYTTVNSMESDEIGAFELESYVNNDFFNLEGEPSKLLDAQDFVLNTSIKLPLASVTRTTKRRPSRTENVASELDYAKRKVNAKYFGDATIRANQRFITNTSLLDEYTVEVFLSELNHFSNTDSFSNYDDRTKVHPIIAASVLATCFFKGSALEEVLQLKRLRSGSPVSKHFVINKSKNNHIKGYWIEEVPLVNMVKNNNSFNGTQSVSNQYRIPMSEWLARLILRTEEVLNQYKTDSFVMKKEFSESFKNFGFVWTITDFDETFKLFFKRIRAKYPGLEINLKKVEQYLLNAALHDYDAVYSAYFTGKSTMHSHSKLFYTRLKESDIQSKYMQFWEQRLIGLACSNIEFQTLNEWPDMASEEFVGSALVPRKDVVKKINKEFKTELETLPVLGLEALLKYHQVYSLYTLFFFSYATGYRGVHDILPNWRLMSDDLKWVVISDKDDLDSSHARMTYLNSMMRQQLSFYFKHLKTLLGKLPLLDFELYTKVLEAFRDWELHISYRKEGDRFVFDLEGLPVFFHIDFKKKSIEALSLNHFLTQLHKNQHIGLPVNGGRHLLRTQAISESIPSDLLDAFLGHFIYGFEPHSSYSALNLSALESCFEPMLVRHLSSMGFKPIKSRMKG